MNSDDQNDLHDPDELDDAPEDPILARSREILSRQPTPEELAEHEERVKRNRLAAALAPLPRVPRDKPVMLVKRQDAGRVGSLLGRQPAGARAVPRGEHSRGTAPPPAEAALLATWAERAANIVSMRPAEAMREIMRNLGGLAVAEHRRRVRLEERIAVLERRAKRARKLRRRVKALEASKPRIRIAARRSEQ